MPKTLYPAREAKITNCMIIVGSILMIVLFIVAYIITMPISLA